MARTKQCARKTGSKAPQSDGAKIKGRYFDAGGEGDGTSKGKKGKNSNDVTSIPNNQASTVAHGQQRARESPLGWVEDRTGVPTQAAASYSSPSKSRTKTREPAMNRKSGKALAIRKSSRRNKQAKKKAAALEREKRLAEKREKGMVEKKKKKKEGRKDKRKRSAAGGVDGQGGIVEAEAAEGEGEGSASNEEEEDGEEEDGSTQEGHEVGDRSQANAPPQAASPLTATPAQALNLEVDGILSVVEPVMRDIFRAQALAQASNTSFTVASPGPDFIPEQLALMRSIVEMYEARGEEGLTRYQAYALESARLGAGELEYMRRSDEVEEGAASGFRA